MLGVLKGVLAVNPADTQWLVGDKITFADMAWVLWNFRLSETLLQSWDEVWKGTRHDRAAFVEEGLQWNGVPKGIENFIEYGAKIAAGEDTAAKD
ncbi:hypothetical protein F4804DRAFT_336345 [Jackrogersella minutella]|nr:hypothetical protein F4804DRAFT_336345 [Jackrogersella minutella]